MKRTLSIILAALLLLTALCACGKQRPGTDAPTPTPPGATAKPGPGAGLKPPADIPAASGTDLAIPEPWSETAQTALDDLRRAMAAQNSVCALACLGAVPAGEPLAAWLETSGLLSELAEETAQYAFLPELTPAHCADTGLRKLCCLVPREEDAAVCISVPGRDDYQGPAGAPVLFATDDASLSISLLHPDGSRTEFSRKDPLGAQPGVQDFSVPGTELTGN